MSSDIDPYTVWDKLIQFSRFEGTRLSAKPNTRNAAVAIVLRFARGTEVAELKPLIGAAGLESNYGLLSIAFATNFAPEILFIKRAVNPRDRWSGHVAFPGGRQEPHETLRETAIRETMEEVGIDLNSESFHYLGALDDRYAAPINVKPFLFAAHVFLQVSKAAASPKLDVAEVAAARWVSLATFRDGALLEPVTFPMKLFSSKAHSFSPSLGDLHFPGIRLPEGEEFLATPGSGPFEYHLWGLTLDLVEDFAHHLRLVSQRGTISYLPHSYNPIVMMYVWFHFFVPYQMKPFALVGALAVVGALGYFVYSKLRQ